ncbi:hypothetical protein ACG873_27375 [Mesorhizobium sp. AaZ16]|uniref:hypothetical protein n=1 Tax=Mesorhizobium sp. AaZ16 TaxID=3402289 RepID=UPI00374E51E7
MARTAPELSIDTSAPWLTFSLSPFSTISRRMDFSAISCSVMSTVVSTMMSARTSPIRPGSSSMMRSAT